MDWVNEKLYWTEELRGEVLVMDINTRRKTVLVANYNSSITRAIAVDPTTRYDNDIYCCSTEFSTVVLVYWNN